jgi:hypothetical protein
MARQRFLPDPAVPLATYHEATGVIAAYGLNRGGSLPSPALELARRRRARALLVLWEMGYTYDTIAHLVGLSRQRVHQIIDELPRESDAC